MMAEKSMMIESIAADASLKSLCERARASRGIVHAGGLWGSSAPMVAATIAAQQTCPQLYVTSHLAEADHVRDDIELFSGRPCELFPAWEALPGEGPAGGEIQAERLRLCTRLTEETGSEPSVIVTPIQALMQPVPTREALRANTIAVGLAGGKQGGDALTPDQLLEWAVDRGFERLDMVESPGDVARRGDIVDLFLPGDAAPYRIQFFGEDVESIRRFDVSTQRSIESLPAISVSAMPKTPAVAGTATTNLLAYLPDDAVIVLDGPSEIQEMGATLRRRLGEPDELFTAEEVLAEASRFSQLHLTRFGAAATGDEDQTYFQVTSLTRFETSPTEAVGELVSMTRDREVHVFCDNEGEKERLAEMIAERSTDARSPVRLHVGVMHRGFEWAATRTVVVAHHEIFHRHRQKRRLRKLHAGKPLETWTDLAPGDLVVHVMHGIARYRGLTKMRKGDSEQQEEFLSLEFADNAMVHVPASQIDLVQKYIGAAGRKPELSKLGGKRWSKTKQKVAESVEELAGSLLRVQAVRDAAVGTAYPADTEWQREFEASFLYEETEDQLLVARELKEDLSRPRPADRLICGDVGYGKTELAMRAAFKVVEYGRQVAVLVPTTVLAEQHYETFTERMADYPFAIGCLSRFRSPAEQRKIIDKLKKGQIDVVIGTHRLVSKDVQFANLGLAIIDEEQRFGVEHKERLKTMRETVDVLTLTATPIPRTLHMSMMGIRDISALQTPPVDRRAIGTQVRPFDRKLIRDAILREMNRDGQVYFIHNFVQSIATMADTVGQIVPEARIVYGHGQMNDHELERVMHAFSRKEADVLVATTIIESGIDNPNVNTIFINRAERFGLADLHQLRGRVGRSSRRAYCYLMVSPDRPATKNATKRLKTIEEFSELGAGFRIAMRDLEIRGAGNLLGPEQSGHIAAVGYEMYCRLLDQTVHRLKDEPDPSPPPVQVDLDVAAHIPRHYIASDRSRIEIYRRIVGCRTAVELEQLERDLRDAFGEFPQPVARLLELAEIRVLGRQFGVVSISLRPPDVIFVIESLAVAEAMFVNAPGTVRTPDPKTVHLRLPPSYLEPTTLVPVLRKMLTNASKKVEAPS